MLNLPERYNVSTLIDANLEAGRGEKIAIYCGCFTDTPMGVPMISPETTISTRRFF